MPFKSIKARQIFDSRGNPTVEVDLVTDLGLFRAAVPSGASTGVHEALEMRDNVKGDWHGKGVLKAVENINKVIAPAVMGSNLCVTQQKEVCIHMEFIVVGNRRGDALIDLLVWPTEAQLGINRNRCRLYDCRFSELTMVLFLLSLH